MVHSVGILWLLLVFPLDTIILPDSASIFSAKIWAIIKSLVQIKDSLASKYIIFTDSLSCLQALQSIRLEHPLIVMRIQKCVFLNFANKNIIAKKEVAKSAVQPVLHDWWNKSCGMCYPVCGMVHIKEPLLLIGKSSPCGGSGFPLSLSEWSFTICPMPYNHK